MLLPIKAAHHEDNESLSLLRGKIPSAGRKLNADRLPGSYLLTRQSKNGRNIVLRDLKPSFGVSGRRMRLVEVDGEETEARKQALIEESDEFLIG